MFDRYTLLLVPLVIIACGGSEPQAKAPTAADSNSSATTEASAKPPSLAEEQQAQMREYTQALTTSKAALEEALAKSDCKAACEAFNAMGTTTKHLCQTTLSDDDQRQCKDAQAQHASERERTEKSCEPCPPPPDKKRHRRKSNAE